MIEPGFRVRYDLYVHCGAEWLGPLNDTWWQSDDIAPGDIPDPWREVLDDREQVTLTVELATDPPQLTAEANGHAATYVPADDPPECD